MADKERYTKAETPKLLKDKAAIAAKEAANSLKQYDAVQSEIATSIERGERYKLRPSTILAFHRIAVEGVETFAGQWRNVPVGIEGSKHEPPHESRVPELMEDLCEHINDRIHEKSPVELAAYTLWRICWIHPFTDGNGRTARAVSYRVLCAALKTHLPGLNTIPEQIVSNKTPYYKALETVDSIIDKNGKADVTAISELFEGLLATQLLDIHRRAKGEDEGLE